MSEFNGKSAADTALPIIETYEEFGELSVGGNDVQKILVTALCMLNHPTVNKYFSDNKLKLKDRITGTVIFPRAGMAFPGGTLYDKETE